MSFLKWSLIPFVLSTVTALKCPDNGKVTRLEYNHWPFFTCFIFTVDETNVTDQYNYQIVSKWNYANFINRCISTSVRLWCFHFPIWSAALCCSNRFKWLHYRNAKACCIKAVPSWFCTQRTVGRWGLFQTRKKSYLSKWKNLFNRRICILHGQKINLLWRIFAGTPGYQFHHRTGYFCIRNRRSKSASTLIHLFPLLFVLHFNVDREIA